jgi:hypothetical protein
MSTISYEPSSSAPDERSRPAQLLVREMWAALAIAFMWLAVLFSAVFGPDIVSTDAGSNTTTIPSSVVVALFAFFGTRVVAKHGLGRQQKDAG